MRTVSSLLRRLLPASALFLFACGVPGIDDVAAEQAALMDVEDPNGTPAPTDTGTTPRPGRGVGHDRNGGPGEVCDPNLPSPCRGGLVCCYPCGVQGCQFVCMHPEAQTGQCPIHS